MNRAALIWRVASFAVAAGFIALWQLIANLKLVSPVFPVALIPGTLRRISGTDIPGTFTMSDSGIELVDVALSRRSRALATPVLIVSSSCRSRLASQAVLRSAACAIVAPSTKTEAPHKAAARKIRIEKNLSQRQLAQPPIGSRPNSQTLVVPLLDELVELWGSGAHPGNRAPGS